MGILRDATYWKNAAQQMYQIRPVRGRSMSRGDTVRFLDIACKALSDLVDDRELSKDLDLAAKIIEQYGPGPSLYSEGFESFLAEFSRMEGALLLQSGMEFDCAVDLVEELRAAAPFATGVGPSTVRSLIETLGPLREKTCDAAKEERTAIRRNARTRSFWRTVKGWAAIGIDCAAVTGTMVVDPLFTAPIVGGTLGAASIGYGTTVLLDAKKAIEDFR